jgi:RNA polymerase sigma-70 factor (ECF subfamily)
MLIQAAIAGDQDAWTAIVQEHADAARGFFLRLTGGRYAESEELMQTAFVKVFQNLSGFRGDSTLRTWMYRIWTNVGRDWLRSRKRDRLTLADGEWMGSHADPQQSTLRPEARESLHRIHAAMNQLPDQERLAIQLLVYEGADYGTISEILGCSRSTVKVHIFHARKKLARLLDGTDNEQTDAHPGAARPNHERLS